MAFTVEEVLGEVEGGPNYGNVEVREATATEVVTYLNAMIAEQEAGDGGDDSHPDVFDALLIFDFAYKKNLAAAS